MGTRHLTCVALDGKMKVAQYGQWDGYPSGQGVTINGFIHEIAEPADLAAFKDKVRALAAITEDDLQALWIECGAKKDDEWVSMEVSNNFRSKYPQYSRDTGAGVLQMIASGDADKVRIGAKFAADSLLCEWCWVLDLDRNVLECHRGFVTEPHTGGRFSGLEVLKGRRDENQYYPVKLWQERPFSEIPDDDDAFCAIFDEPDEDED